MLKIGVIGAGYWGKKHVEEYCALGMKPVVSDLDKKNLDFCKKRFSVSVTKNYEDILNDKDVEGVSVCTPNETHFRICKEALLAGKHVLLEKPMTLDYEKAQKLVELAKGNKKVLMVGHIFRFNNAIRKMKEYVKEKRFGKEIYIVKLTWTNLERVWDRDIIFDLATHPFDIVNFLFDRNPSEITCIGEAFRKKTGEEAAFVNAKINKTLVNLELSWLTPEKIRRLVIVGSEKSAFVNCLSQEIKIFDYKTGITTILPLNPNNTIKTELEYFLESISNNKMDVLNSAAVGAEIIKVLVQTKKALGSC